MHKNYILYYLAILLFCWPISSKSDIALSNLIKYSATIFPPGYYKIAIWDKFTMRNGKNCNNLFDLIQTSGETVKHFKCLFKYYEGIEIKHFAKCFINFYIAQSNEDGKFEVNLSDAMSEKINFQIFPINKKKELIRSDYLPSTFLQSSRWKAPWKNCLFVKQWFQFYNVEEKKLIIGKMFENWLWHNANANPSDGEAFFFKAFLQEIASSLVEAFTIGGTLLMHEMDVLRKYGHLMKKWQKNGILATKLAQIDRMPNLIKNLCTFLVGQFRSGMADWHLFCNDFLDKMSPPKQSILERMNIAQMEENENEMV